MRLFLQRHPAWLSVAAAVAFPDRVYLIFLFQRTQLEFARYLMTDLLSASALPAPAVRRKNQDIVRDVFGQFSSVFVYASVRSHMGCPAPRVNHFCTPCLAFITIISSTNDIRDSAAGALDDIIKRPRWARDPGINGLVSLLSIGRVGPEDRGVSQCNDGRQGGVLFWLKQAR